MSTLPDIREEREEESGVGRYQVRQHPPGSTLPIIRERRESVKRRSKEKH